MGSTDGVPVNLTTGTALGINCLQEDVSFVNNGSGLEVDPDACKCKGTEDPDRLLHIFYRLPDNSSVLTAEVVRKALEVELEVANLQGYRQVCLRQANGRCHGIVGFPMAVHVETDEAPDAANPSIPLYNLNLDGGRDVTETAQWLQESNVTIFFNLGANSTHALYLHSIAFFCDDLQPEGIDVYRQQMMPALVRLFKEQQEEKGLLINYGEREITEYQVNRTLALDALWAILSLALAAVTLRLGCGSCFLTTVGIFQIVVSFPLSWVLYSYPTKWSYLTFLHILAPFVIFGIGLDDIFVFVTYFKSTQKYASLFALDTRLTATFNAAAGATLATSTTSALAFLANMNSPVPAIQSFGLFLGSLVIVNYLLSITWIPLSLVLWEAKMVLPRRRRVAIYGPIVGGCGCGDCGCLGELMTSWCGRKALDEEDEEDKRRMRRMPSAKATDYRDLEYDELLFWDRPPQEHRLSAAREERQHLSLPNADEAKSSRGFVTALREDLFDWVFVGVWRVRWVFVAVCVLITILGAVGTSKLEPPPTSEPPLFDHDHNVQFFFRFQNSEEAENVPQCSANCQRTLIAVMAAPDEYRQAAGLIVGADGSVTADGDPNELALMLGANDTLVQARTEENSRVRMTLAWGLTGKGGIDNSANLRADPSAPPFTVRPNLTYSSEFDPSDARVQRMILDQVSDSVSGGPPRALVVSSHPFKRLLRWCDKKQEQEGSIVAARLGCNPAQFDNGTGLPVGEEFNRAVFFYGAESHEARRVFGYASAEPGATNVVDGIWARRSPAPRVAWVRAFVVTSTRKGDPPEDIAEAYEGWVDWATRIQEGGPYEGMVLASEDWVTAVTYVQIAAGVVPTVFYSILLTGAVVFVFAGKPMVTLLSTLTVVMINVTVMGATWLMGWYLGALEGMSITSLVGLSVDFCIHISEAHMHAHGHNRYIKARAALGVVGVPMISSAVSTVMTTLPLFAATTLVLRRFASVIAITMIVGFGYVVLFLTPCLGMFGPDSSHAVLASDTSFLRRMRVLAYESKAVRFVVLCLVILVLVAIIPSTSQLLAERGTFATLYSFIGTVMALTIVMLMLRLLFKAWQIGKKRKSKAKTPASNSEGLD